MLDATLVIVNFDSGDRLAHLLDDLHGTCRRIIVLDNASPDGSGQAAVGRAAVELIENPANTGFAAGANRAVTAATAPTEWFIFLNPDAHPSPAGLTELLDDVPDDVGAIAPLQIDELGTPRAESGGYRPSLWRFAIWALLPAALHGRLGPWVAPPFPSTDTDIPWVSGAVLAVRRSTFESAGGFDERYFLYLEDVALCERIRAQGERVVLRAGVRVFHEVGNGDPYRRARELRRSVDALGAHFIGIRRFGLGVELLLGFSLRALAGSRSARHALPACFRLLARP